MRDGTGRVTGSLRSIANSRVPSSSWTAHLIHALFPYKALPESMPAREARTAREDQLRVRVGEAAVSAGGMGRIDTTSSRLDYSITYSYI